MLIPSLYLSYQRIKLAAAFGKHDAALCIQDKTVYREADPVCGSGNGNGSGNEQRETESPPEEHSTPCRRGS